MKKKLIALFSKKASAGYASRPTTHDQQPTINNPRFSSGFSLLEVLVATTVLMIIVLAVAMVFQQSSGAWSGGTRRANAAMTLRSVLGQMQREMIEAVDAREFTNSTFIWTTSAMVTNQPGLIKFVSLLGDPAEPDTRIPFVIQYNFVGAYVERSRAKMRYSGTGWTYDVGDLSAPTNIVRLNSTMPLALFQIAAVADPADPNGLPLRVDIQASVSNTNKALLVSGRSAGRDKSHDTDDDIRAGK